MVMFTNEKIGKITGQRKVTVTERALTLRSKGHLMAVKLLVQPDYTALDLMPKLIEQCQLYFNIV